MYKINPEDKHLVEEFKANPIGLHSADLQKLLNVFRGAAMENKYALLCTKPHEEWVLAQLPGARGGKLHVHHNRKFHSIEEAEWEIFKMRWKHYTGETLED
ncbi:MAG: hypothetical protein RIC87_21750 [Kiloniellales bacterium]